RKLRVRHAVLRGDADDVELALLVEQPLRRRQVEDRDRGRADRRHGAELHDPREPERSLGAAGGDPDRVAHVEVLLAGDGLVEHRGWEATRERRAAIRARDRRMGGDDGARVPVGLREDRLEALVDRVREDECTADHRDAEHDRERRQRRAELPPGEALQGDAGHSALSSFITASTSAGSERGRSRTIRPSARKRTRSAIAAARGSWVTMTVVWPKTSTESRIRCRISSLVAESRLPVGSSAKTTVGRETSARAIATRCCWPPESSAGRWRRRSERPTFSSRDGSQPRSGFSPAIER